MGERTSKYPALEELAKKADGPLARYRRQQHQPLSTADVLASLSRAELEKVAAADTQPDDVPLSSRRYPLGSLAREFLGDPDRSVEAHRQRLHQRDHGDWHHERIDNGMALADRFLNAPGLARAVHALTDEAEERSVGRQDVGRFVAEQHLKALQLFTFAARVPPGEIRTAEEFGYAMSFFLARGDRPSASVMQSFAYYSGAFASREKYLNGADVHEDHLRWAGRHCYWQDHARGQRSRGAPNGRARRGTDGSSYILDGRKITIQTAGGGTETVAFAAPDAAAEWLANRTLTGTGPLRTTADGAPCRTSREDEILARLLHAPDDAGLRACTDSDMFTSHLRAELHRVLAICQTPDQVRPKFADAMLRAPGWALRDIGFPDGHRALRYLDRLQATPVSEAQARDAALTVRAARDQADRRLFERSVPRSRTNPRVPPPRPAAEQRTQPLLTPPPQLPAPASVTPRLLSERIFVLFRGRTTMNRRTLSSRAAAARRAQAAKAERDQERREREKRIEAALTDYYQAVAEADRIRAAARAKAERLAVDAELAAAQPDAAVRDAVRRLKDLVGGSAEVARLCGISVAAVREFLAAVGSPENTGGDVGVGSPEKTGGDDGE